MNESINQSMFFNENMLTSMHRLHCHTSAWCLTMWLD